jgi:anti-sigma regulatory factor (Ser/Thr protein kinase)
MASMTATTDDMVLPVPDQRQPPLACWPLRAALELGALPTAPGCARAWTRRIIWEWRLSGLAGNAELIVSELVTNAVLASRTLDRPAIWLALASDRQQLVILVRDYDPAAPAPRHPGADDESGRGLMLVEAISDQSGWFRPADGTSGKVVWALMQALLHQMQHPACCPGLRAAGPLPRTAAVIQPPWCRSCRCTGRAPDAAARDQRLRRRRGGRPSPGFRARSDRIHQHRGAR